MGTVAAGAAMVPASIARALAIPADRRTGTIEDVKHVVILMQENRSFDHYFGTLRGVRGFGDPRPALQPDGKSIWRQPAAKVHGKEYKNRGLSAKASHVLPWYINPKKTTEFQAGTNHGWGSGHGAWNDGRWDQWVTHKQDVLTMGYLRRQDVSFHYALADAFTVCDAYHCSVHSNTCPNRIYLWTGTCDPQNGLGHKANGPGLWERAKTNGYTWTTYPERLEAAGISWKVYQGGTGEPGTPTDNYTDNSLEFFSAYQVEEGADPKGALVRKGVTDRTLEGLRKDVLSGNLAQVTWIVSPYKYSEHPEASPRDGAYYINKVLEALTADPKVWAQTALFLNYDENDGLFDHIIPPMPPVSSHSGAQGMVSSDLTASLSDEFLNMDVYQKEVRPLIPGYVEHGLQPIGLGPRVPMIIVSPWTRGGWTCSEVFDHTSVLRFLEARFGIAETNISAWRRAVCGDLTSAFDFKNTEEMKPVSFPVPAPLISERKPYQAPEIQTMPVQEEGRRPARALPYELVVNARTEKDKFWIEIENRGRVGVPLQIQDRVRTEDAPRRYAISSGDKFADHWEYEKKTAAYHAIVHGPNGFLREFSGAMDAATIEVAVSYIPQELALYIQCINHGEQAVTLAYFESYGKQQKTFIAAPGSCEQRWNVAASDGWYDLSVSLTGTNYLRRFAGHIENGCPSMSDPAFSAT